MFKQYNLTGDLQANLKNNWGPRFAFTYRPESMDSLKFYGSYARTFIPPAMNLGFRGRDLYFYDYFNYPTGYDFDQFTDSIRRLVCPLPASEAPTRPATRLVRSTSRMLPGLLQPG